MDLKIGKTAPLFDLPSTSGKTFSLNEHKDKPLILYFYPKDFTNGCIKEACSFRDHWDVFSDLSINIIGISTDNIHSHLKFIETYKIPFPLLSDERGEVCRQYNAWIPFINLPKRITYVLKQDLVISGIFSNMFQARKHVDFALTQANNLH